MSIDTEFKTRIGDSIKYDANGSEISYQASSEKFKWVNSTIKNRAKYYYGRRYQTEDVFPIQVDDVMIDSDNDSSD
jgi:hypothetical protein